LEGGDGGGKGRRRNTEPEKSRPPPPFKKTSSYSNQPQHIQLTHTPTSGLNVSPEKHTYAFKNR